MFLGVPNRAGGTGMAGVAAAIPIFLLFLCCRHSCHTNIFTFSLLPPHQSFRPCDGPALYVYLLPSEIFERGKL